MDDRRFDRFAREMAGTGSRRVMLGRAFGVGMAGLLAALGWGRRAAGQEECAGGSTLCPRGAAESICVDLSSAAFHCGSCGRECFGGESPGGICVGGACASCDPGLTACYTYPYGRCVDRTSDPLNCGACDTVCGSGVCENGACVDTLACPEGQLECGDRCVDVSSDFENCGACFVYCPSQQCQGGVCVTCEEQGLGYCPGQGIGNICTDLNDNDANCGSCGNVCEAGTVCILGACQAPNAGPIYPPDETPPNPTAEPDETAPPAIAVDEPTSTPHPTETARGTATEEPSATAAPTRTPAGPEISGGVVADAEAISTSAPVGAGSTETPTTERRQAADPSSTEATQAGRPDVATATGESGKRCPATDEDENELLARRWYEALDDGDLAALDGLLAPDATLHAAPLPGASGPAEVTRTLGLLLVGFPDHRSRPEQVVTEGDAVVVRWTASGTHEGEYLGIAATGREATWTGIDLFRIDCGRIVEVWSEADGIGLLRQLGALPVAVATP